MKPAHFLITCAIVVRYALCAVAAEPVAVELKLRFVAVGDIRGVVSALGPTALLAVASIDVAANTVTLDLANPEAKKVRELIARMDQAPPRRPATPN